MVSPEYLHRRLMSLTAALHECSLSCFDSDEHRQEFDRLLTKICEVKLALFVINIDKRLASQYSASEDMSEKLADGVCFHG